MRSLDGHSEGRLRETGDKEAGSTRDSTQNLTKEALSLSKAELIDKVASGNCTAFERALAKFYEQVTRRGEPAQKAEEQQKSESKDAARKADGNWKADFQNKPDAKTDSWNVAQNKDVTQKTEWKRVEVQTVETQKPDVKQRTDAQQRLDTQRTEARQRTDAQQRIDTQRTEARQRTEAQQKTEQQRAETRRVETQKQVEQQKAQADQRRIDAEQNIDKSKQGPGLFENIGGKNWKQDKAGNFVTMAKDGTLLTKNQDGKLVDYESQMNKQHMKSQDQMAFASILFMNPLMLLGMGAAFAFMDHRHAQNSKMAVDNLKGQFDVKTGKGRVVGVDGDLAKRAVLISQLTKTPENDIGKMNQMSGLSRAMQEQEDLKRRRKRIEQTLGTKVTMPTDRYSLNSEKLIKHKRRLEEHIEKVRGKASLEEMSQLYTQMELLDKALKRMSNLSL